MTPYARPLILSLEGNIGAGKSTFLRMLGDFLNAQLVFEPHQQWQNIRGENLLDYFYRDTQRWAYAFQTYAFVTRVLEQEKALKSAQQPLQILERSVFSDRYCFAKNCFELGVMNNLEWQLYQEWFGWLVDGYVRKPDAFIYLRTDPEICHQRLQKRNRSEETGVTLEYLRLLHTKHEDWLVHRKEVGIVHDVPVLILACNEDFEHTKTVQESHVRVIADFLAHQFQLPAHETMSLSPSKEGRPWSKKQHTMPK